MKNNRNAFERNFANANNRWAAVGPYYAMFPLEFAHSVINKYSKRGQIVLDPFAGRASSVYLAATQGRHGVGIEINPVGWVYAQSKLFPASKEMVARRLKEIIRLSPWYSRGIKKLPRFFRHCYSEEVLKFLLCARNNLDWQSSKVDRTLMAIIMVYLHGKPGQTLSNQMNFTKAMGPTYSIKWWKKMGKTPPEIDCYDFFEKRIEWRYAKGLPLTTKSQIYRGDSTKIIKRIYAAFKKHTKRKVSLLFTSPPYQGLTNYYKDQWLRLWLLGGNDSPLGISKKHMGRFESEEDYESLLRDVFKGAAGLMSKNGVVYVRTSARKFTYETTLKILKECFPNSRRTSIDAPIKGKSQTSIIGNSSILPKEVDIILKL